MADFNLKEFDIVLLKDGHRAVIVAPPHKMKNGNHEYDVDVTLGDQRWENTIVHDEDIAEVICRS